MTRFGHTESLRSRKGTAGGNVFREANAIARQFTRPIVMSKLTVGGECTAQIGAYVVVNNEGNFVTAFHISKLWQEMAVRAFPVMVDRQLRPS